MLETLAGFFDLGEEVSAVVLKHVALLIMQELLSSDGLRIDVFNCVIPKWNALAAHGLLLARRCVVRVVEPGMGRIFGLSKSLHIPRLIVVIFLLNCKGIVLSRIMLSIPWAVIG